MIPIEDVFRQKTEKEKEALQLLFNLENIPLTTTTRGKAPSITALYRARVIFDLLDSMDGGKQNEVWHDLNAAKFYEERAPSIGGRHSDRAVEIARAAPPQHIEISWLERLMGKQK